MSGDCTGACGCCAGVDAETPARIDNPPGQPAIAYRAGEHASFKESLLAGLSGFDRPALRDLTTRADADFSIALCDSLAVMLDVVCFYQERIANESYLRTATERRSLLELTRLIGYELAPGVAAATRLAFTLHEVPGSPALAAGPVKVPVGTRVQSVPGQDEKPQSFETVEEVEARAEWNAIPVQTSLPWRPKSGDRELHLAGLATGLQPGDAILIVGEERLKDATNERWDVRVVTAVDLDPRNARTRIRWGGPLGHDDPPMQPADMGATVHVFRQRAALFGHNAPDPRLLNMKALKKASLVTKESGQWDWDNFDISGGAIDLDAPYPKIMRETWFALVSNKGAPHPSGLTGYVELFRTQGVSFPSRVQFGLSGKVTRLMPEPLAENLDPSIFEIRETLVLAQSEQLAVAETPLFHPLYGATVALGRLTPGIAAGRALAVRGKRARVRLRRGHDDVEMTTTTGEKVKLKEGDCVRLAKPPEKPVWIGWRVVADAKFGELVLGNAATLLRFHLIDRDGAVGVCVMSASAVELVPAEESDGEVAELAVIHTSPNSVTPDRDRTTLTLAASLKHCYDRTTVRINANVARATHGETVMEIVGSGDARVADARYRLRQSPLTYVSAPTAVGRKSTLELRVNDLEWKEARSLYDAARADRKYGVSIDDDARATVQFGDGVEGARPPSGDHNIRAKYRKGIGLGGNLAAGKLTNLLSRPPGVTGAWNPEPATGGEDPETTDRARTNAPLTTLTLERAVSIRDYRDFARAFPGVAKAHSIWIPCGPARGVFVTVAGEQGAVIPNTSDTYRNLFDALRRYGDPLVPLRLVGHRTARFRLRAAVKVRAEFDPAVVLPNVEHALRDAFGFERRDFGQGVSEDEATALIQETEGVEAAHVSVLNRDDPPTEVVKPRLFAALPAASSAGPPLAAELLLLDGASLRLDVLE